MAENRKDLKRERELQRKGAKFEALLDTTQKIHGTLDLDEALELVVDAALKVSEMQRGFIMLFDDNGELQYRKGRNISGTSMSREEFDFSHTIVDKAVKAGKFYYFVGKSEFSSESVARLQIGSGLCIPLYSNRATSGLSKMIGVLYLDSRRLSGFGDLEEQIITSLAAQAGLALENAMLYELATRDALTRLYQRHYFESLAFSEWKRSNRHQHNLSLLMIDIDHFKNVNDTYGHEKGDQVLRQVAAVIRSVLRHEDTAARYGGEEFIVLLPETDSEGAERLAARMHEKLSESGFINGSKVTISIGVAAHPDAKAHSIEELMKLADQALYQAKGSGRNRTVLFESSSSKK